MSHRTTFFKVLKNNQILGLVFVLIVLDQLLKTMLLHTGRADINTGAAFGLGGSWLVGIGLLLFSVLAWQNNRLKHPIFLAIILAALSNVLDRVRVGGVIDYIPIGPLRLNLADVIIVGLIFWIMIEVNTKKDA